MISSMFSSIQLLFDLEAQFFQRISSQWYLVNADQVIALSNSVWRKILTKSCSKLPRPMG